MKRHACSLIGTQQFREMEVREQQSKGTLLKTAKRSKEKEKEKEKDQGLPSRPFQMAAEGWSYTPEQRRAIMTATQILNSGTLGEESFWLLEQLVNRTHHQQTTVVPGSVSSLRPKQQPAPPGGAQAKAEPSEERATERKIGAGVEPRQLFRWVYRSRGRRGPPAYYAGGQGVACGTSRAVSGMPDLGTQRGGRVLSLHRTWAITGAH